MNTNELNNKMNVLWNAVNTFSEKYKIYIRAGHSWLTDDIQHGAWIVNEVYISREHDNPEFHKCHKKMFYMGINKNRNCFIENKKGKLIHESDVTEINIHDMLFDFIVNYLQFFIYRPKPISLADFIKIAKPNK